MLISQRTHAVIDGAFVCVSVYVYVCKTKDRNIHKFQLQLLSCT